MRLLLKAWNTDSEYANFGRYAVVDLDDEMIKLIAARRKLFLAAREQDKQLYEMYFWNTSADFYGASFGRTEDHEDDGVEEAFDKALGDKEWVEIPEDFDTSGEAGHPTSPDRTDCDQMIILEDGVMWHAADHYGDTITSTARMSYEALFGGKL